jgi:hypothetical protein
MATDSCNALLASLLRTRPLGCNGPWVFEGHNQATSFALARVVAAPDLELFPVGVEAPHIVSDRPQLLDYLAGSCEERSRRCTLGKSLARHKLQTAKSPLALRLRDPFESCTGEQSEIHVWLTIPAFSCGRERERSDRARPSAAMPC